MNRIEYLEDWAAPFFPACRYDLASSNVPFDVGILPAGFDPGRWTDSSAWEMAPRACARLGELYGVPPEQVVLTPGASGGIFLSALAHSDAAAVVVETPVYEPLHRSYEAFGTEVRFLERRAEDGYRLEGALERARDLAPGAALVVVTNPHNPSGRYESNDIIVALAEAVSPAILVVDEVYLPFVPGAPSSWGAADNICVVNSLTKAWGLVFLRFGWAIAPPSLATRMSSASFYTPGLFPAASAAAALEVLADPEGVHQQLTQHLQGRLDAVDSALSSSQRLSWERPSGDLIIGTVQLEEVDDDIAFARSFMEAHDTALAPGSFFGAPGTLRLGIGATADRFDAGFEALLAFADRYSA